MWRKYTVRWDCRVTFTGCAAIMALEATYRAVACQLGVGLFTLSLSTTPSRNGAGQIQKVSATPCKIVNSRTCPRGRPWLANASQAFSLSMIQIALDLVRLRLRHFRKFGLPFREVLPHQSAQMLVAALLPATVRVGKEAVCRLRGYFGTALGAGAGAHACRASGVFYRTGLQRVEH